MERCHGQFPSKNARVSDGGRSAAFTPLHPAKVRECLVWCGDRFAAKVRQTTAKLTLRLYHARMECASWLALSGGRRVHGRTSCRKPQRCEHRAPPPPRRSAAAGGRPLKLVAVFAFEPVAGVEIAPALVIFPDLVIARLTRRAAQRFLSVDVAFGVAFQLQEARLLVPVPAVGEDHQDFAFGFQSSLTRYRFVGADVRSPRRTMRSPNGISTRSLQFVAILSWVWNMRH
jgi:hypothetical protein